MRSVAILIVCFEHGTGLLSNSVFINFPYLPNIDGVNLFFVLSGFLIGGILLKQIRNKKKFGLKELALFWKRRWFRTLPNYYLFLLINYLLVYFHIITRFVDSKYFSLRFFVFMQNFSKGFMYFFWESWSLSVEEWFYVLCPLLLIIALKLLSPKKSFLLASCMMILFSTIYRASIHSVTIDDFWYDQLFRRMVVTRLDSIGYGLIAAWVFVYFPEYWKKFKLPAAIAGIIIITFLINHKSLITTLYSQVFYFTLWPVSIMLILPLAENVKKINLWATRFFEHISKISYSMYLVNALLIGIIRDNFLNSGNILLCYLSFWILLIFISTIIYQYFELPVTNFREIKFKQHIE